MCEGGARERKIGERGEHMWISELSPKSSCNIRLFENLYLTHLYLCHPFQCNLQWIQRNYAINFFQSSKHLWNVLFEISSARSVISVLCFQQSRNFELPCFLFIFVRRKDRRGTFLVNIVGAVLSQCFFFSNILEQAMMCVLVHYALPGYNFHKSSHLLQYHHASDANALTVIFTDHSN